MSLYYRWNMTQLPFCCGMYEVGDFVEHTTKKYGELPPADTIVEITARASGRPVIFNFVQNFDEETGEFEDEYICQHLMDVLMKRPDVVDLGTWINPSSDNRIHGFMLKGNMES